VPFNPPLLETSRWFKHTEPAKRVTERRVQSCRLNRIFSPNPQYRRGDETPGSISMIEPNAGELSAEAPLFGKEGLGEILKCQ
jgi:hypothetical protein